MNFRDKLAILVSTWREGSIIPSQLKISELAQVAMVNMQPKRESRILVILLVGICGCAPRVGDWDVVSADPVVWVLINL